MSELKQWLVNEIHQELVCEGVRPEPAMTRAEQTADSIIEHLNARSCSECAAIQGKLGDDEGLTTAVFAARDAYNLRRQRMPFPTDAESDKITADIIRAHLEANHER